MDNAMAAASQPTWLDRLLNITGEVRVGEGATALLLALNGFLILAAYYVIRPLRDSYLLPVEIALPGGATLAGPELRQYAGGVMAALFLFIVPAYGAFASKVSRVKLINWVTVFFVSNLVVFFLLGPAGMEGAILGISFYLWVGIFNLMVVAQFWSFANDIYTPEQGKRLFAIVGFGASMGAIAGSLVIGRIIRPLGLFLPLLVSGGILLLCLALTNLIHRREKDRGPQASRKSAEEPLGREGGFQLVLKHRYLLLIGLLTLTVQFVNTNGNYILVRVLSDAAAQAVASGTAAGLDEGQFIGAFQASLDLYQNILVVLIQLFLVSRIFKWVGVGGALFFLPVIATFSYGLFILAPVLSFIRLAKILENATDYSLQNTLRRALFLPTSREAKYKALQAVETFFWRGGDMMAAIATYVLIEQLQFSAQGFAGFNLVLVGLWLVIAVALFRENRRLTSEAPQASAAP
jgi:AAA family ATP:ADP antiporter